MRRVITAPIGYESDTEVSRLVMWLSSHTQPRWKSGSCSVPFLAWSSRSTRGTSPLVNFLSTLVLTPYRLSVRSGKEVPHPTALPGRDEPTLDDQVLRESPCPGRVEVGKVPDLLVRQRAARGGGQNRVELARVRG